MEKELTRKLKKGFVLLKKKIKEKKKENRIKIKN